MFGWDDAINGAIKLFNDWRADKRQEKTENTGKQLQAGANAQTMAKEGQDAARNEDAVGRMSDDELNKLLR